jgi:hypothetical protein
MSRSPRWRRSCGALAVACLAALALGAISAGSAHAASTARSSTTKALCGARSICLFSDADFEGHAYTFKCGWVNHGYTRFVLRDYGFTPDRHDGVSSYISTLPKYATQLVGRGGSDFLPRRGSGNISRVFNDLARTLNVWC